VKANAVHQRDASSPAIYGTSGRKIQNSAAEAVDGEPAAGAKEKMSHGPLFTGGPNKLGALCTEKINKRTDRCRRPPPSLCDAKSIARQNGE